jgi:hypothetical protein
MMPIIIPGLPICRIKSTMGNREEDSQSGIGNRESGIGNRESAIGNRESGIGNRESAIGNKHRSSVISHPASCIPPSPRAAHGLRFR